MSNIREKYTIGLDFGTLSGRAVLARVADGKILAEHSLAYPHGILKNPAGGNDTAGRDGAARGNDEKQALPPDWALEDPEDYLTVIRGCIPALLSEAGVPAEDVIGLGLDCTSCTLVPVGADGLPLSMKKEYENRPHAWCKLWKHHAAQEQADRVTDLARKRGEEFLDQFGGKISSEWLLPKILQIREEDPDLYGAVDVFMDMPDFLVFALTGIKTANVCGASYKGQWSRGYGYFNPDFLDALAPGLSREMSLKLCSRVIPLGSRAGELSPAGARLTGLLQGTPVAAGNIDAHVSVPGAGITNPGEMLMIIGTSTCSMICEEDLHPVKGMCGCVKDGILPGLYGYEAGQPCVGDCFGWFTDHMVPRQYELEAAARRIDIHEYLSELAAAIKPGESGLLALDWWNGNRSVQNDADLSGAILGLTLETRPAEIYRALIESTAFGVRKIRDRFQESGVTVKRVFACGGISLKNPLLDQIYADVLGQEIFVSPCLQTPALGSAMFGAVAAGKSMGGYDSIAEASRHMADHRYLVYTPDPKSFDIYNKLYALYAHVYELFGEKEKDVMHALKRIRRTTEPERSIRQ